MARPSDFPPPFGPIDAIGVPTDPPEERIDVGVLIVGGGPGGLACAIRLGQLLEEHPEMRERLGDVPVAVLEKGKQPGSHVVSGAVVSPRPLRRLFRGRLTMADLPSYGEVPDERVFVLTRRSSFRIPPPPTMRNHGNYIFSASELSRFLGEQAEALGVAVLPETSAVKLLAQHGRVLGARTGDKGRGRHGEPLPNFEPGNDIVAGVTVLAEGSQGLLTSAAIDHFRLEGENPQIWALGVKEVWRVPRPLGRIVHTMGWPLRSLAGYGEFGGSFIYPMSRPTTWSRSGSSPGSRRATSSSRCTTSSRSSRRTGSCGTSCAAASASAGARKRSRKAATTRCRRSSTRRASSSSARARAS